MQEKESKIRVSHGWPFPTLFIRVNGIRDPNMAVQQTQNKNNRTRFVFVALTVLVFGLVIFNAYILTAPAKPVMETGVHFKGSVTILVKDPDGKIVSQTKNDTIFTGSYDFLMCVLFNDPVGCSSATNFGMMLTRQTTVTTTATLPLMGGGSFPLSPFIMDGIGLSANAVTAQGCSGLIIGNGLDAANSATSHTIQTNSILLTESWTFSGGTQAIQSVCLFPVTTSSAGIPSAALITSAAFAWETFATQTLTTGQSITVQWTFSF